jgi:predicted HicB family RNase H-like nuclease
MEKNNPLLRDPIPEFETLEDIADFWDTHSTADYDDLTHEAQFDIRLPSQQESVTILPELEKTLSNLAQKRGVSLETLINVWLTEKAMELSA